MKTYYKVVWRNGSKLVSTIPGMGEVRYLIRRWTTPLPGNGPLCVYKSLDDIYGHHNDAAIGFLIFECKIIPSSLRKVWYQVLSGKVIEKNIEDLVPGTVLADKVKLIRRVIV
jgi:hypothetical protein